MKLCVAGENRNFNASFAAQIPNIKTGEPGNSAGETA